VGETAGGYVLDEEIASGGLASVHRGHRRDDPSGPPLAIKRLHSRFAGDRELVAMFLEEARIVRRLRHRNVVALLDVVATEPSGPSSGEVYLVLEYVRGASLADLARAVKSRGEQVPPEILSAIAIDLLEGLHAAHEATDESGRPLGIVHRDVSPENVLVGVDGVARVVDFGIAKALDRALPTTRLGGLKGKMAYMAPEQISGAM
jgi:serine/threonine-protein kinase